MRTTLSDRVVGWFSPQAQLSRLEARNKMMALEAGYDGGSQGRRQLSTFNPTETSPDASTQFQARTIRSRSRELARNSALALGAINTTVTSVVGTGLELHSRVDAEFLGMDEDQANKWQANAERLFRGWAENEADISRESNFYELQSIAFRSVLEGGDCLAALPYEKNLRPGALFRLRVQLIEAELLRNPNDVHDTDTIVSGVEVDPNRTPIRYHICNQYNGRNITSGKVKKWTALDAFGKKSGRRNVLHLKRVLRPGQTRGVPFLAPVIEPLKQLKDYTEAEITAAVVSGMYAVFIETPQGNGFDPLTTNPDGSPSAKRNDDVLALEPGLVATLGDGEKATSFNPGRPNTAFDPFVQAILRQIGVALEIPFEILIKHFTASYSAARAALIEAWRFFKARREWLTAIFCQPVYEAWMDEAVSEGLVIAPGYFDDVQVRRAYLGSEWTGDGMGQLNPLDEINAAKERVALGVSNRSIEASEIGGRDWKTIHRQLAIEEAERKLAGLTPDLYKAVGGMQPGPSQPKQDKTIDAPDTQDAPDAPEGD